MKLTHITRSLHRNPLQGARIRAEMCGHFRTSPAVESYGGRGNGCCDGFARAVIIDSDVPQEQVARLPEVCRKACMPMETEAKVVPASKTLLPAPFAKITLAPVDRLGLRLASLNHPVSDIRDSGACLCVLAG